jgi:FkbM family methyltransferase
MMINLREVLQKYNIQPKGVVHIGAHFGQEADEYIACGIKKAVFVEPCKGTYDELVSRNTGKFDDIKFFNVACGADELGMQTMNVSKVAEGQSNSLLKPKLHLQQHPEVIFTETEEVEVKKLDNLDFEKSDYDFLMMDVQGYELEVLKGATELMKNIKIVYSEVNNDQTYEGNALIEDLDNFLHWYGFERVETYWPSKNWSWGDSVWVKR